ncbi:lytic murein transglycosylase [Pseudaestuariivita rosea]|uniref:lytic murein transglycosylase n=1 Tax=Pseudaestuariivita rosea TaxID=2763263 RepID=UPI001F189F37|nr:lytic murein transglycosylase [Pseudaestuariivita rosea]
MIASWGKAFALAMMLVPAVTLANAPDRSIRPEARVVQPSYEPVRFLGGSSLRPQLRPDLVASRQDQQVQLSTSNRAFQRWIDQFKRRARGQGISQSTLDAAFQGVSYNTDVISRDRNQAEFTKTIWQYLETAVSQTRIRNGREALRKHARVLDQIEARYGVDKEVVVAVWGLESAYGSFRGDTPIIEALATLAFDGRRGAFFEEQLIAALKIIQNGDTDARNMTGSWAGAMGHTQFIPTSYLAYAVDFRGDGKRDIWSEDPTDALASTAAYLANFGWQKDRPWGVEVKLPRGFNYAQANRRTKKSPAQWGRLGVVGLDGKPVPNYGQASILLPAGAQGAAFMIFKNFEVIERYNSADAYVIGVGHLSDRLKGRPAIQASWPTDDRALTRAERRELQERLTRAGFSTQGVDGRIGPNTISAIRAFQRSKGLVPDGYASLELLQQLR